MPVHESPVRIVFPGPYVKRVERGQAKTIGAFEIMEELSHELRRALSGMGFVPIGCNHEKVSANQLQMSVRHGFVDDDLRTRGVNDAGGHEAQVHKMHAHCSRVRSADAAEKKRVSFSFGYRHILETSGVLPNNFQKSALRGRQL